MNFTKQHTASDGAQPRWVAWTCLVLVLIVGWYVRLEDVDEWARQPELFSYEDHPLLVNLDGHLYLRWARDLVEGSYAPIDELRSHPDGPPRPSPPPLLSVLVFAAHRVSSLSLNWIAILLPALLGPLVALPLWRISRLLGGGTVMAATSALTGVLSVQYVSRSRAGWFDTDCLILSFTLAAVAFFMAFALDRSRRRYLACAGGILTYWLFLWWWDTTPDVVSLVSLTPLAIALLFYYRPSRRQGLIFGGALVAGALPVLLWQGFDYPLKLVRGLSRLSVFLSGEESGPFPGTGGSIEELLAPDLMEVVGNTTGNLPLFLLSIAGLGWLTWQARARASFILLPVAIAASTFLLGARFTMFLAPVTALGLGFLADRLWAHGRGRRWPLMPVVITALIATTAWPAFHRATDGHVVPAYVDRLAAMDAAIKLTPQDAVIWTTWEMGYPLMYYGARRVIADGIYLEGERLAYAYRPLATADPRLAANLMRFYVTHGMAGLRRIHEVAGGPAEGMRLIERLLAAGPQQARPLLAEALRAGEIAPRAELDDVTAWIDFLFPRETAPVYLLLHRRLTQALDWHNYGTWNLERRAGNRAVYKPYHDLHEQDGRIVGQGNLSIDPLRGGSLLVTDDRGHRLRSTLSRIVVHTGERVEMVDLDPAGELHFEWIRPQRFGALMTRDIAESVFNQLFIRHQPGEQFRAVALRTPAFQLWEAVGG